MGFLDSLKELSMGQLVSRLYDSIKEFVSDVGEVLDDNREMTASRIEELREHIEKRLKGKENVEDNAALLKLIDLFAEDKAILEFIRYDAGEWLDFLDAIKQNLRESKMVAGDEKTLQEINALEESIKRLEAILRK
jgi:hypothetical protein